MDLGRLRGTDYVVGVLALALLGSLFLDWFEAGVPAGDLRGFQPVDGGVFAYGDLNATAWEAYAVTDIVLAVFALMSLGIVVLTAVQQTPAVPIAWTALTSIASVLAVPFALIGALTVPEGYVREIGPVLGPALTLALTGAVWSAMRSERPGPAIARSGRADVETLPAPRP